jgi:hypothetical protein
MKRIIMSEKKKEVSKERAIDQFHKKYGDANDESFHKASFEKPELLKGIILDEELSSLARSHALMALAWTHNKEYFSFIKGFIKHESPFLREIAFRGLFQYYDAEDQKNIDLKELFKTSLENEKSNGVIKRITELLKLM